MEWMELLPEKSAAMGRLPPNGAGTTDSPLTSVARRHWRILPIGKPRLDLQKNWVGSTLNFQRTSDRVFDIPKLVPTGNFSVLMLVLLMMMMMMMMKRRRRRTTTIFIIITFSLSSLFSLLSSPLLFLLYPE